MQTDVLSQCLRKFAPNFLVIGALVAIGLSTFHYSFTSFILALLVIVAGLFYLYQFREVLIMGTKNAQEPLNHLAQIILDAIAVQHNDPGYLEEKREHLAKLDKFYSLRYLASCSEIVQADVARKIGVPLGDLRTAIRVTDYC